MSDGDVDRPYTGARSERHGNDLITVHHVCGRSTRFIQRSVCAAEQGLGAADCGNIKEEAQMGCQAESPRMGHSLPVHNQQVRACFEFTARRENQRRLAERKKPGHVRPVEFALGCPHLYCLQVGVREHYNRCPASPADTVH